LDSLEIIQHLIENDMNDDKININEIKKSIDTICYVIEHMYHELKTYDEIKNNLTKYVKISHKHQKLNNKNKNKIKIKIKNKNKNKL
jgi:hypothetical protein